MEQLKPCPFCGGNPYLTSNPRGGEIVLCQGCGATAFVGQWNHRHTERESGDVFKKDENLNTSGGHVQNLNTSLQIRSLSGSCRSGSDNRGRIFHIVPVNGYPAFSPALCGAKPGKRSAGWSDWVPQGQESTCVKCNKKRNEIEGQKP